MARATFLPPQTIGPRGRRALLAALVLLGGVAGCRSVAIPPGSENPEARATLSGSVSGPDGVAPVTGRQIEAVEIDTGQRHTTETNETGGFSFLLPPGRYRLEVTLGPGESVIREPGSITLEPSSLVAEQNVILGGAGVVGEG